MNTGAVGTTPLQSVVCPPSLFNHEHVMINKGISMFVGFFQPLRRQINALMDHFAGLRKARDLLLSRLMNWEVAL